MSVFRIPPLAGRAAGRRWTLIGLAAAALAVAVTASQPARSATTPAAVTVSAVQPVYLVHAGQTAQPGLVLTTAGGQPLDRSVTVSYQTGGTLPVGSGSAARSLQSTAVPGTDYTATSGSVTFPAGTASGTSKTFSVTTLPSHAASEAKTINITLSTPDTAANVTNDPPTVVIDAHGFPYLNSNLPISQRVSDLLSRMSLPEKIGQMTQADRYMFLDSSTTSNSSANNLRAWYMGSLLSGGGDTPTPNTPTGWADMVDGFQSQALATPLQIPLIYGEDTVHGVGNMIGATVFPHNIGIGATRDPALAFQEGQVTASETRASGPQWGFAPCICVARDIRWGRTYESFGSDPALVSRMETEISGLQGTQPQAGTSGQSSLSSNNHILATAKHFAGDGGTSYGTGDSGYPIDQGVDIMSSRTFQRLFVSPYVTAVRQQQVGSIMPSYSSVQLDGASCPTKMSADKQLLTNDLKQRIGFSGFLISDYNAVDEIGDSRSCPLPSPLPAGVPDPYSYKIGVSANAGMDMFMVPSNYQTLETDLTTLVNNGVVPMSRVDDAVRRVLTQKFQLGLFEHPYTDRSNINEVGDAAHRAVAARAAAESQVLLKNAHNVLPLSSGDHIYVAGSNADNLGSQTGGWTLSWQGQPGPIADPGTTILQAIKAKDPNVTYSADASAPTTGNNVGVVVVGEHPYAEGPGDVGGPSWAPNGPITSLDLTKADQAAVDTVCHAMRCVVMVVSGRPMTIGGSQLSEAGGLVASWLPGTEGEGVANVLFGQVPFSGQLPQSWPRDASQLPLNVGDRNYNPLFPSGWGLRTTTTRQDVWAAQAALSGGHRTRGAQEQLAELARSRHDWNGDGSARRPGAVLETVQRVARRLSGGDAGFTAQEAVVTIARDLAQAAAVRSGGPDARSSTLIGQADHALLTGDPQRAVQLLTQVAG
ncbi:MAG TPA: glycoside hydrolase family 3 N-terminal domain-containing protein [Solirubrobacteraceae bacterium]|nr:glycoside hydrolase family 3 N-terminal domain-containing protein [Solirubrobacteraceae bacterium]